MQRLADKIVNEDLSVRAAEAAASATPKPVRSRKPTRAVARGTSTRSQNVSATGSTPGSRSRSARRKGQIVVDFATIQDLNRILGELGEPSYN